jgi:hypothetical protein
MHATLILHYMPCQMWARNETCSTKYIYYMKVDSEVLYIITVPE